MTAPLTWIKRIAQDIPELNIIPLFGNSPPFNWKELSQTLSTCFDTENVKIAVKTQTWRPGGEMKKGLGARPLVYPVVISPIGTVFWVMPQEDMIKITSWLLKREGKTKVLASDLLQEGFYRYLLLEALSAVSQTAPMEGLSIHLSEEERVPEERTFCIDVEIAIGERSCWGRLVVEQDFRTAWVHHFEQNSSDYIPSDLSHKLFLDLSIETGSVLLSQGQLQGLEKGDFVALDRGSYDTRNKTGTAMVMLGRNPIFNVKINRNQIELMDYAFYYEDNMQQDGEIPFEQPENLEPVEGEVAAIKDLPLMINVEISRIKLTLDELMHLNPGNVLDLPIHPDQSVSLVVNGKKVGRAELLHLGDTLGLRILEIG